MTSSLVVGVEKVAWRLGSGVRYVGGGRFHGDQQLPNGTFLRVGDEGIVHSIPGAKCDLGCTFGACKVSLNYSDVQPMSGRCPVSSTGRSPASSSLPLRRVGSAPVRRIPTSVIASTRRVSSVNPQLVSHVHRGVSTAAAVNKEKRVSKLDASPPMATPSSRPGIPNINPQSGLEAMLVCPSKMKRDTNSGNVSTLAPNSRSSSPKLGKAPLLARALTGQNSRPSGGVPSTLAKASTSRTFGANLGVACQKKSEAKPYEARPRLRAPPTSSPDPERRNSTITNKSKDASSNVKLAQDLTPVSSSPIAQPLIGSEENGKVKVLDKIQLKLATEEHGSKNLYAEESQDITVRDSGGTCVEGTGAIGDVENPAQLVIDDHVDLRILSISGESLVAFPTAPSAWTGDDIVEAMNKVAPPLPGLQYHLTHGDQVVGGSMTLGDLFPSAPTVELLGVKARKEDAKAAQEEMNLALMEAAGALDLQRVTDLLEVGANAAYLHDPPGVWGAQDQKTALSNALENRHKAANKESVVQMMQTLLRARADINAKRVYSDWRGSGRSASAFEMALDLCMDDVSLLKLCLDSGADPNTQTRQDISSMRSDGVITLHLINRAVSAKKYALVQALLDRRAHADSVDKEHVSNERGYNRHKEETGLHIACRQQDLPMVALLLSHGANVNAIRKELLLEDRPKHKQLTPQKTAMGKKCIGKSVVSQTDDPREAGYVSPVISVPVEESALHIAILGKSVPLVAMLLFVGADTDCNRKKGKTMTPVVELCGTDEPVVQALNLDRPSLRTLIPPEVLTDLEGAGVSREASASVAAAAAAPCEFVVRPP